MDAAKTNDLERFLASARRVVDYLRARTPLTDWSVSRVSGGAQVHLHVNGEDLLHRGDRVPWPETFCRRMLGGAASVVADAQRDDSYADLPAAATVRAYAGAPIIDGDGSLFGTLCGVRAEPLGAGEQIDHEMLVVFSDLLSTQLALVRSSAGHRHAALLAQALANSDQLTGLMNRRGWELAVAEAEQRVDTLGDRAVVMMIDLDGLKTINDTAGHDAGDALIAAAADALRAASRPGDRIARHGGDEFTVLLEDAAPADLAGITARFTDALAAAGIAASVGVAPVEVNETPGTSIGRALADADAAMYAAKIRRRTAAASGVEPR